MKILYISYAKPGSGAWVHTTEFVSACKSLDADFYSYLPESKRKYEGKPENKQRKKTPGFTIPFIREIRVLFAAFLKMLPSEMKIIKQVQPDLVILRAGRYLSSILWCRYKKIPILVEVNGPVLENRLLDRNYQLRGQKFWTFLERKILSKANHLLVVSEQLKQYFVENSLNEGKITTVPNGVDISKFHPQVDGSYVREKYGLTDKIVIGFSGALSAWHGLDFLIETTAELLNKNEKLVLFLIGKAKKHYSLPKILSKSIILTGHISYDQMPAYLAATDFLVAPYPKIEPFYFSSLKILEAMAMGKAVLASAQGQICKLISDGKNGFLYPPNDKKAFLKKLNLLIADEFIRNKLGKLARAKIQENYTWHQTALTVLNLCQKILTSA